ncbi:MAG: CopD family protein [Chloroflexi bacterium]|nr:CopD family protein [Chloroflexota bacterium]
MPPLLLALSYWLHMLATIVWVGGLAMMALVAWPGAQKILGPGPTMAALVAEWQRRFNPLAWLSLAVLIATGLTQMTANKNYAGFLNIANAWTAAILTKHIAVGGMIVIGAFMNGALQPALARLALLESRGKPAPEIEILRRRELALIRLNLACGILVLALTAVARAVG